jgi:phosphate starvation-inducible PhoH-like protein
VYSLSKKRVRAYKLKEQPNTKSYNNNTVNFQDYVKRKTQVTLIPRNRSQEDYVDMLLDPSKLLVFAVGPAGTGKTMLAVLAAIKAFKQGEIEKIILTRPAVGVDDEKHGFLPGDINQKMEPWTKPLFDIILEYYNQQEVKSMMENGIIEISPLAYMRGRTFKNAWIIADEMQNSTPNMMKMLLTRIGENSKMVITGDIRQADKKDSENGLLDFQKLFNRFQPCQYLDMVTFGHKDIERHPAVAEVLSLYGED